MEGPVDGPSLPG